MKIKVSVAVVVFCIIMTSCNKGKNPVDNKPVLDTDYTQYVNPFYGTGGFVTRPPDGLWLWSDTLISKYTWNFGGGCYPGVQAPFGMVQLSPDTHDEGYDHNGGYHYMDSTIMGFSHLHTSGNGPMLGWILFQPTVGTIQTNPGTIDNPDLGYRSRYSHEREEASPGYYRVDLIDYNTKAELTSTERVGFHRYSFPKSDSANIILDLSHKIAWGPVNYPDSVYLDIKSSQLLEGYVGRKSKPGEQTKQNIMYFVIELSKPAKNIVTKVYDSLVNTQIIDQEGVRIAFTYSTQESEAVMVKVALSPTSIAKARENMRHELDHWNFGMAVAETRAKWNNELSKIKTTGGTDEEKVVFYSSLYRTMHAPFYLNDHEKSFTNVLGEVEQPDYQNYTFFSMWDTYRAIHPLFTIIQQDKVNDMMNSIVEQGKLNPDKMLPLYSVFGSYGHGMVGHSVMSILAEAYLKGFRDFDYEGAYALMKDNSMRDHHGLGWYREMGYIPQDSMPRSVSEVLEYSYADWSVAQMAKALGYDDDYKYFMERCLNYKNLFDPETSFFRPRMADGSWMEPFDPRTTSHQWRMNTGFVEANAWQYLFHVQHDIPGLIKLMGGKQPFVKMLDSLFDQPPVLLGRHSGDVSGLVGQYAAGNEPTQHVGYLYNYAGQPWKSQKRIRQIMKETYNTSPHGIPGNDDAGQLAAWYVFSAIGFYPVNPAEGKYLIGTPSFESASMEVGEGKTFTVRANKVSDKNMYIQNATLNDDPLNRSWITHEEITNGGTLIFEMADKPNKEWAKEF